MSGLCKYKDVFGKPGEGSHAWRLGGLAGADLLLTAGAALLLSRTAFRSSPMWASFLIVFIILILLAVGVHRLFCVDTALNRMLGLSPPQPGGS